MSVLSGRQVAVPSGKDNMVKLDVRGMAPYVDFWNLMVSVSRSMTRDKTRG